MPTTTTLNTRLFAPHIVLTQDTTRLAFKIKSGEGYTLPNGLTLGDVIRFDPPTNGYTLSQANTEPNAEVLGVIESISSGEHTVVCAGSIKYPISRLNVITAGSDGGVDVLFLDENIRGGLTGTIDLSSGQEKIVKPVIQVAPHAGYNGIVMNYVGYKTGNQAVSQEDAPLLPVGSVMYSLPGTTPGINWLKIDEPITVNASDYSELYSTYGKTYGWNEKLIISTGNVTSISPGDLLFYNAGAQHGAQIIFVDTTQNYIIVAHAGDVSNFDIAETAIIDGVAYTFSSSIVYEFIIPAVVSTSPPTQNSTALIPYIKAYESVSIKIPEVITLTGITASNNVYIGGNATVIGSLQVGTLSNIETEILALKAAVFPS